MHRVKQVVAGALAVGLPLAATVMFMLMSAPVYADGGICIYAGQEYSEGGCVRSVCTAPEVQMCVGGVWTGCRPCGGASEGSD
jgi:hypothetical protein